MTEKEIHEMIFKIFRRRKDVAVGPGDDCAAIDFGGNRLFLLAVDQLVSDVHYKKENTPASSAAKKLLNRNLSDIAAMGGLPAYALLTIAAKSADGKWHRAFFSALEKEAKKWGVCVCGGDISSSPSDAVVCALTIGGWVEKNKVCLRSSAKAGDLLYATGEFGNSFAGGRHLSFVPRLREARFLAGRWTKAMIDVSDGLLADAKRMAEMSGAGLILHTDKIPLRRHATIEGAMSDGEDYELIFAVPREKAVGLEKKWPFRKTRLTYIGEWTQENPGEIFDAGKKKLCKIYGGGYDHFKKKRI